MPDKVKDNAYITPRGVAKIEAELEFLRNVRLPELIDWLQDSMAGGDTIDNSEYMLTQEELALANGRIQELDHILRNAELINPGEVDGIIHLGSTVVIQEEGADLETYTIVGPAEADPCEGCISNRSPLGRALLDHTIGDVVEVKTPDGLMCFRIIAVS